MNETMQTIMKRRSVRQFEATPIPRETLDMLIEVGCMAPSPMNNQPWRFIVVQSPNVIAKIAASVESRISAIEQEILPGARADYLMYRDNALFFRNAPALIFVLLKPLNSDAKGHLWGVPGFFGNERCVRGDIMSIGAACQNIMLAARSLGLGSCMMLYPLVALDDIRELLGVEEPWQVMACIPVGYGTGEQPVPQRRPKNKRVVEFLTEDQCARK